MTEPAQPSSGLYRGRAGVETGCGAAGASRCLFPGWGSALVA
ncbi:hypothetical protein Ae717Ps2_6339c [Pseudonocardia sp. Ae717_Ps2]|nr:hypothetical protein Ae717Ps2_6886 [Pseudonocardia sp. Ae717_Ps2]OLM28704.1 hypothetical protein Ae717Ps2_6302c [Pseudonocardia sp. Ae717_Ps2]OLM28717.1 hypothetical protein Ae717Ps2_6315c [Pseudonocardia sp. Ae717_Ps2]OLM28729.1 hypothetical protein Ae717Ps2_6327c [Pseudonocardia sp. Ae717_Ps2]OLM28741.1 hypothetical protein Ae717Ps2_6339c [Pseudonocardia sp. Ae717_Ps2]